MEFNEKMKNLFDASVDQSDDVQANCVEECVNRVYDYICNGYTQSRECVPYAIMQLERVPHMAICKMFIMAMEAVKKNSRKFLKEKSSSCNYYDANVNSQLFNSLLDKVSIEKSGEQNISQLNLEIAKKLTLEERKKMVGCCVQYAETLALTVNWNESVINLYTMLQVVMYSICEKDDVMDLFFNMNNNVMDRFGTSGQYQHLRDFAESLLIIGHQQGMIAEAYFCASRAYTGTGNAIAGLLYLNIALLDLDKRSCVRQELAFDIIGQMLKIMRASSLHNKSVVDDLLWIYEMLNMDDYNTLSIYHTAFTVGMAADPSAMAKRVEDFLNEKREIIFKHMQQSAGPWYTLIRSIRLCGEMGDYPMMQYMENMMKNVLKENKNENLINLCEGKNQKNLLFEELVKLEATRDSKDLGYASKKALFLARNVLDEAFNTENVEEFILAMRPKSDFSFAMPEKKQTGVFKKIEVVETEGKKYKLSYGAPEQLAWLMNTEKNDCTMWIGRGNSNVLSMILMGDTYKFCELQTLKKVNAKKLQSDVISQLKYSRVGEDSCGKYDKDITELEKESQDILRQMQQCSLFIPKEVNRLFFIRDLELSPVPHQLMIDEQTNRFIGEMYPSANSISTEFLIKSNFNNPLPKGFSKSYWSPLDKETMFAIIKDSLSSIFEKYHFVVDDDDEPLQPLHADLNIVCAHGAKNISETEWFYANDAPIVNSYKVVGSGKILVLFTCHSGSITYQHYDNALHSIIKKYLKMGYSSVVAPMWSLNIEILPTWLDVFLQVIETGGYVVDAVYQANMKVKERFISPAAWACFHLFGNPYMQIADGPALCVTEEPIPSKV